MEGEELSAKRARIEEKGSESEGSLQIALSGDSELESASSPGPKRWQKGSKQGRESKSME